jgi:L-methionine (R)-S-oxide reductase
VSRDLTDRIRDLAGADAPRVERAPRVADAVRAGTGHPWVGVYAVEDDEVVNLAWSGPGPPAHRRFAIGSGLTGAPIEERATIVSNDVATDSRYLRTLDTTGSEIIVPVIAGDRVVGTLDVERACAPEHSARRTAESWSGLRPSYLRSFSDSCGQADKRRRASRREGSTLQSSGSGL